jgi:hypothetical protein
MRCCRQDRFRKVFRKVYVYTLFRFAPECALLQSIRVTIHIASAYGLIRLADRCGASPPGMRNLQHKSTSSGNFSLSVKRGLCLEEDLPATFMNAES